jgi:hypothetical protein
MYCNLIAGAFSTLVSLCVGYSHLGEVTSRDAPFILVDGVVVLAGSFTLLTLGPALIPAPEVSLITLIETILGPVWVWLGGYEAPPALTIYGGVAIVVALFTHRYLRLSSSLSCPVLIFFLG